MEADELLEKIRVLEEGQAELKREIGRLIQDRHGAQAQRRTSPVLPPPPSSSRRATAAVPYSSRLLRDARARLSDRHCHWILQSLGQAVHIIALDGKLLYW